MTEQFNLLLEKLTSINMLHRDDCFVCDFIVDFFNICNIFYHLSNFASMITRWCANNDLAQLLKQPTRSQTSITDDIKATKESPLDHVCVDNFYIHKSVDVIPTKQ